MSDAEFDTMLRSALLEAVRQDWAHILENDHLPEPQFSSRFLRWERKVLADPFGYARRRARPLWKRAVRTAACILLCAGIAFGGLMAFSPQARAWVVQMIAEWRETHTKYTFTGEPRPDAGVGVWRPSYVPEGFEETDSLSWEQVGYVTYQAEDGRWIDFTYMLMDGHGGFSNDNEHSDYCQITIKDYPADLYISNTQGKSSHLIWVAEDLQIAYALSSQINYQELISMAESVEKIK